MPFFLYQVAYSSSAANNLVHHPQHREEAVRRTAEALGGKLHQFFFAIGEYDCVALVELPSNTSAVAMNLSVEATGALRALHTTVLISADDAVRAMQLAQTDQYVEPK
ncbi:MAG: GYD domain-containing protein [Pseudomonadota bacterium]|jgi:hypothetical protein